MQRLEGRYSPSVLCGTIQQSRGNSGHYQVSLNVDFACLNLVS